METNLIDYLNQITVRGTKNQIVKGGFYDPRNINLKRTEYLLYKRNVIIGSTKIPVEKYYDKELGEASINATQKDIETARQVRRKNLEEKFELILQEPKNLSKLVEYAEEIAKDGYYEIAEEILGKVLNPNKPDPNHCYLLARINIEKAELVKRNKKLQLKYNKLAKKLFPKLFESKNGFTFRLVSHL